MTNTEATHATMRLASRDFNGTGLGRRAYQRTGLSKPECSCRACLESIMRQHAPGDPNAPVTGEQAIWPRLNEQVREATHLG